MLFPALGHGERDPLDRLNISRDGMFTADETPNVVMSIYATGFQSRKYDRTRCVSVGVYIS